jgi:hypothetical protein
MKETAVRRIWRCRALKSGSSKVSAASRTPSASHSPKPRIRAAENAVSARVAVSLGSSSSASWPVGWFVRRPSRRATTSLPKRLGGASPALRAPRVNAAAASPRPSALTSDASSAVIVTVASGAAGTAGSCSVRPATSSERVPCVSGESGLKVDGLPPIRPRAVTSLISGCAHEAFAPEATAGTASETQSSGSRTLRRISLPIGVVRPTL